MVSLYKCISDGIHWGELSDPLTQLISPWFKLFFCLYMSFVLFAVMNVVIANFIEVSIKVSAQEEKRQLSAGMLVVLQKVVASTPGSTIDRATFEEALEAPEM